MFDFGQWFRKTFCGDAILGRGRRTKQPIRSSQRNTIRLGLEALEVRMVPSGVDYATGGAVLSNVEVSAVYYGPAWNSTQGGESNQLNTFLGKIVQSPYWRFAKLSDSGSCR
jgi:hypothetical protein